MLKPSMLLLPILLISNAISASGPMIKMPDNSMLKGMLPTYGKGRMGLAHNGISTAEILAFIAQVVRPRSSAALFQR
jgi:hypothetical protein